MSWHTSGTDLQPSEESKEEEGFKADLSWDTSGTDLQPNGESKDEEGFRTDMSWDTSGTDLQPSEESKQEEEFRVDMSWDISIGNDLQENSNPIEHSKEKEDHNSSEQERKLEDPGDIFDFEISEHSLVIEHVKSSTPSKRRKANVNLAFPDITPIKKYKDDDYEVQGTSGEQIAPKKKSPHLSDQAELANMSEIQHAEDEDDMDNPLLNKALHTAKEVDLNCCLQTFTLEDVKSARYKLWTKSLKGRTEWMLDKFEEGQQVDGKYLFTVKGGVMACRSCFCSLYKLNKNFFYKCKKNFLQGHQSSAPRKQRMDTSIKIEARCWLYMYAKFYGDDMPDKRVVELPYKYKKIAVYRYEM